mmetsp:Transcript_14224/g.49983  ORF Transcript_14224/g.49983 Transcript_14224/m.49983 type:complete len:97 (+) Transcript_14224:747-1037(+)
MRLLLLPMLLPLLQLLLLPLIRRWWHCTQQVAHRRWSCQAARNIRAVTRASLMTMSQQIFDSPFAMLACPSRHEHKQIEPHEVPRHMASIRLARDT